MEQLDYKGLISLLRRQTNINHTIRVKATKNLLLLKPLEIRVYV